MAEAKSEWERLQEEIGGMSNEEIEEAKRKMDEGGFGDRHRAETKQATINRTDRRMGKRLVNVNGTMVEVDD